MAAWIEDYTHPRRHSSLDVLSPLAYQQAPAAMCAPARPRKWFDVWQAVHGHGGDPAGWGMLERVPRPGGYARAMVGNAVVAVGRALAEVGSAGVQDGGACLGARHGRGPAVLAT